MGHVPHELHEEFPHDAEILHRLKMDNHHFQVVADRYHSVNRDIHRIESGVDPAADHRLADLKHQRLAMLDEVSLMIDQQKAA